MSTERNLRGLPPEGPGEGPEGKTRSLVQNLDEMLAVLYSDTEESRVLWDSLAARLSASKVSGAELRKKRHYIPLLRRLLKVSLVQLFFEYVLGLTERFSWLKKH